MEGSGFDGVAVLVTRYYGGVQLGAGGRAVVGLLLTHQYVHTPFYQQYPP